MSDASPSRSPSTWKALLVTAVAITLVCSGLWYWRTHNLGNGDGWSGGGPLDVVATTVKAQAAPVRLEALGEVRAVRQVTLAAEVPGRVSDIAFEAGQQVEADTVLVQLDDGPEQADLAAARAAALFAQSQFTRASNLADTEAVSREMLQQRETERDQTAAQIQQLEARIRQKRILAPFSGKLGLRHIDLGQYVNAGDQAVSLTDLDQLYVRFDVPQHALAQVRVGQPLQIHRDPPGSEPIKAAISAIEPQINRNTRNATLQAEVDNRQRLLQPGMYVSVHIALPAETDALVLPATAVMTSSAGNTVVVVRNLSGDQIGIGDIVPVEIGRRLGDHVVISKGLREGDVVLTEGQLRVRPGVELRVQNPLSADDNGEQG